jgi:hypothetical protein
MLAMDKYIILTLEKYVSFLKFHLMFMMVFCKRYK